MVIINLKSSNTADRGSEEAGHVVEPLGGVQGLEPRGLVRRGVTQGPE